jgi:hypothetical protein
MCVIKAVVCLNVSDDGMLQCTQKYYFGLCCLSFFRHHIRRKEGLLPTKLLVLRSYTLLRTIFQIVSEKTQADGQSHFLFLVHVLKIFRDQESLYLVIIQVLYKFHVSLAFPWHELCL